MNRRDGITVEFTSREMLTKILTDAATNLIKLVIGTLDDDLHPHENLGTFSSPQLNRGVNFDVTGVDFPSSFADVAVLSTTLAMHGSGSRGARFLVYLDISQADDRKVLAVREYEDGDGDYIYFDKEKKHLVVT